MGKTYKDQRKYDKKSREREGLVGREQGKRSRTRAYDELVPDDEPLDRYEELDYLDDYSR